jgi:hypothetical protein
MGCETASFNSDQTWHSVHNNFTKFLLNFWGFQKLKGAIYEKGIVIELKENAINYLPYPNLKPSLA